MNIKKEEKERLKPYKTRDESNEERLFIKWVINNYGIDVWNDIYYNYKNETLKDYPKGDVPTHSFGGVDNKDIFKENNILKIIIFLVIALLIGVIISSIIIIIRKNKIINELKACDITDNPNESNEEKLK